jgi:HAD superfamily hydrolase (TIGR01549 family)
MAYILFDLDDTLLASEEAFHQAYVDLEVDLELLYSARQSVKSSLPKDSVNAHNRWLYFKKYLELNKSYSTDSLIQMASQYESSLLRTLSAHWMKSGYLDVLKKLKKNHSLAVLTNENLRTQMLKLNLIDPHGNFFDFVLTSEELGVEKPSLLGFKTAQEKWGCKPHELVMVGDSFKNDIEPALVCGYKAVWITGAPDPNTDHKYSSISNLNDLEKTLEAIL